MGDIKWAAVASTIFAALALVAAMVMDDGTLALVLALLSIKWAVLSLGTK